MIDINFTEFSSRNSVSNGLQTDSSFPPANKHGFIKIDYPFFALNPGPLPGPEEETRVFL